MSAPAAPPNPPALPPPPRLKFWRHPIRVTRNNLHSLLFAALMANIGMFIAAACYFNLFELWSPATDTWHVTISNDALRHAVRDVSIGLLGGFLAQQIVWNPFRRHRRLTAFERDKLHIPEVGDDRRLSFAWIFLSGVLGLIEGIPGFLVAYGFIHLLRHYPHQAHTLVHFTQAHSPVHAPRHTGWIWRLLHALWADNWDRKVMGYAAAFCFGRRPVRGVWDDLQLWFVERRVLAEQAPPKWYPPAFQARYHYLHDCYLLDSTVIPPGRRSWLMRSVIRTLQAVPGLKRTPLVQSIANAPAGLHGRWVNLVMRGLCLLGVLLAIEGFCILRFVAR